MVEKRKGDKMRTPNRTRTVRSTIIIGMFIIQALATTGSAVESGEILGWGLDTYEQATPPAGEDFVAISAGKDHNVAVKLDGSLVAWGYDGAGQVSNTPAGYGFVAVSAGYYNNVALKSDGSLVAWGYDAYGQVSQTPKGTGFKAVSAGKEHNVALRTDGSLIAWGRDNAGQVSDTPAGYDFVAVSAGYLHNVALKSDGSLVAWGYDLYGQVSKTPKGTGFKAVSAGASHNVALKSDGSLIAWGYDLFGQVSDTPAGNDFVAISAGKDHNIALKSDGSLVAWGGGGDAYRKVADTPRSNGFIDISAGSEHSVAIRDSQILTTYTLTTNVNPSGGGYVTVSPGKSVYNFNEMVQLIAYANTGYTFSHWSGDATGTSNSIIITIKSNETVTANFDALVPILPTVSITATDASAGEPANNGSFRISRTGDTSSNLLVYYSTSGSTASSGTDYSALSGYVYIYAGQSSASIPVTVYDDSTVENSETVRVTISSNAAYTLGSPYYATVTITDDDVVPVASTVTITATDASAGEPSNNGSFSISRTGDTSSSLLVYYSTSGSTASAGTDYAALPGYVYILAGQSSASIPVTVHDDSTVESPETVRVTISSNAAYTVGSPSYATVTITDDDYDPPTGGNSVITITAADASAGEPSNHGYCLVSRTVDTAGSLRVYYSTAGSTASAGADYAALSGYVDFSSGQSVAVIYVAVIDDNIMENTETVQLTISSNAAYSIGSPSSATVTIADDDNTAQETPVVTITAPDASAGEPSNNGYFTVSRTGATSSSLRVYYSTGGSTASAGADYAALPGYVDIPAGQYSASISVAVIDDSIVESSEIVRLTISSNAAYNIGSPSYATVTITDNDYQQPQQPVVTITAPDASAAEPANDGYFRISRTGDTSSNLLVYCSTSGTAAAGADYAALSNYVYILAGQSSVDVPVVVYDDSIVESSETVRLTISSNAAYTLGSPYYATVTIADNDNVPPPPTVDVTQMMADTLTYFYASEADKSLVGTGNGKSSLVSFKKMLESAYDQIEGGDYAGACGQLSDALSRCDGGNDDYVTGDATATLEGMIQEVMDALGC